MNSAYKLQKVAQAKINRSGPCNKDKSTVTTQIFRKQPLRKITYKQIIITLNE